MHTMSPSREKKRDRAWKPGRTPKAHNRLTSSRSSGFFVCVHITFTSEAYGRPCGGRHLWDGISTP
nr:MAG TPA: hypothetical protein [Caudoviricetes sp.]DAM51345.1 MAG TPA: hypothetical protein [Caudoviricetes sp.]DAU46741.1 MAG TPA: hypothetical protein [Caudoviricetes sp.]DAX62719.1 MAG TPA: hypothetical protein [Caudoviricetes sp.]